MASFYANENFPRRTVEALRMLGHDVLTTQEAGNAGQAIPDDEVLAFATRAGRVVLTLNRRDFIRLHKRGTAHRYIKHPRESLALVVDVGCARRGAPRRLASSSNHFWPCRLHLREPSRFHRPQPGAEHD